MRLPAQPPPQNFRPECPVAYVLLPLRNTLISEPPQRWSLLSLTNLHSFRCSRREKRDSWIASHSLYSQAHLNQQKARLALSSKFYPESAPAVVQSPRPFCQIQRSLPLCLLPLGALANKMLHSPSVQAPQINALPGTDWRSRFPVCA